MAPPPGSAPDMILTTGNFWSKTALHPLNATEVLGGEINCRIFPIDCSQDSVSIVQSIYNIYKTMVLLYISLYNIQQAHALKYAII